MTDCLDFQRVLINRAPCSSLQSQATLSWKPNCYSIEVGQDLKGAMCLDSDESYTKCLFPGYPLEGEPGSESVAYE